jgi:hypothetical protein
LPGIILETNSFNLLIATARLVLSMNYNHCNRFLRSHNDLICTGCSPNRAGGKRVNNAKPPMKSMIPLSCPHELLTAFRVSNGGGEQVLLATFQEKSAR